MRRTRWLFLAAILVIVVAVGATYLKRKASFDAECRRPPRSRSIRTRTPQSQTWHYWQIRQGNRASRVQIARQERPRVEDTAA